MPILLNHDYEPRGACKELFKRQDSELLISGPAGTGKSRACLEKLHLVALLTRGMRGLILRKTAASLGSTALVTWREHVVPEALEAGLLEFYGGSAEQASQYRYTNGSVVTIAGMDRPSRIMSSEYDFIYVQEATELKEDEWEALTTRLRNGRVSFQQLLADANPNIPTHWLKIRTDRKLTGLLESRHKDNPILFDSQGELTERGQKYLAALDNLTGVRYQRLRRGLWIGVEGLVYEEYDPAAHLVSPFEIPNAWTRWWSVDFGFTNPFVCQFWAESPDGELFLYRELYQTKQTVDQHAAEIKQVSEGEPRPRAIICDHDAEGRAVLERELGLSTVAAHKSVTEGLQKVQERFKNKRLFLFRDALIKPDPDLMENKKPTCTSEELPGYIWDQGRGKSPKEQPVKEDDHGCDAMRYLVAQRDLRSRPRIRVMG